MVQTECEANILGAVRGLKNRSVGTCVYGVCVTLLTFLLYRKHFQQILTLVTNKYLLFINHGYFSVGWRNTSRRYLAISTKKKKRKDSQNLMSYEITQSYRNNCDSVF